MKTKTVTIFGSSLPKPGEPEYEDAYKIGKILGSEGFNVCSGGFMGIMDAVSKGVTEAGKEAIGITVPLFNSTPSKYLTKEVKCETLFHRIDTLVAYGDAFIVLPGGTGTLLELSIVWELFNKKVLDKKPVACFGDMWKNIVDIMEQRVKYENRKQNLVKCFNNIDEVSDFVITNLT